MEITTLNKNYNIDLSSKKTGIKYNSNEQTTAFDKEVLNWKAKMKEKIKKEQENDNEKNMMMSEKQWQALIKKVDSAINTHNGYEKENDRVDRLKSLNEDNRLESKIEIKSLKGEDVKKSGEESINKNIKEIAMI
ncbi:hypothetical protein [Aminipila terrae]|uniref:Uncharacterized protein n=1 Tax=Aminipila terrae TaxID=2697030 RepID=A0A6P1MJ13_9FIRM|nr:hypothetical protein [Aminipila terrae]QHI71586.1 hypothetical protein Ami3637_03590 [Aminipila terrae]